jgi:hypothetical protein
LDELPLASLIYRNIPCIARNIVLETGEVFAEVKRKYSHTRRRLNVRREAIIRKVFQIGLGSPCGLLVPTKHFGLIRRVTQIVVVASIVVILVLLGIRVSRYLG